MALTEDESSRLILVRALEWEALPVFGTRSIAPIAMFWFQWWQVCLVLAACSLIWYPISKHLVSLRVGMVLAFANNLYVSVLANIVVAVVFFCTGRVAFGFVALFWHFISTLLSFAYPRNSLPTIQEKLQAQVRESSV